MIYSDRWISCTEDEIRIRGYYFPWGTKRVPYATLRQVRRVPVGILTGRGRLWGTANLRYWASLGPGRPHKRTALILDSGGRVQAYITPDDPDAVCEAILRRSPLSEILDAPGPVV